MFVKSFNTEYLNKYCFLSFVTRSRDVAPLNRQVLPFKVLILLKNESYVIIKGSLQGQDILTMYYYLFIIHTLDFLNKIWPDFTEMTADTAIVGGDFYCIFHPLIYRYPHSAMALTHQANSL